MENNVVYIAMLNIPYGTKKIFRVFSSKEKAEEYRNKVKHLYDIEEFPNYYQIEEWEITN